MTLIHINLPFADKNHFFSFVHKTRPDICVRMPYKKDLSWENNISLYSKNQTENKREKERHLVIYEKKIIEWNI